MAFTANVASVQQVCGIVSLQVHYDDPTSDEPPFPKTPVVIPCLYLDDHEIYFLTMHPEYSVSIIEDDTLVYSVAFPSTTSSIVLPSWLSGDYEIVLRPTGCNYYFYGYINI